MSSDQGEKGGTDITIISHRFVGEVDKIYALLYATINDGFGKRICLQRRRPWFDSWVRKICWRRDKTSTLVLLGFPCGSGGKESACYAGELGSIPGLGRSPEKGTATHSSILAKRIS